MGRSSLAFLLPLVFAASRAGESRAAARFGEHPGQPKRGRAPPSDLLVRDDFAYSGRAEHRFRTKPITNSDAFLLRSKSSEGSELQKPIRVIPTRERREKIKRGSNAPPPPPSGVAARSTEWGKPDPARLSLTRKMVAARGTADHKDAELVAHEIARFPEPILQRLAAQGTRVIAVRDSTTEYHTHLRGVRPRGWPPDATWDSVPGTGDQHALVIATRGHGTPVGAHTPHFGDGHGSFSMPLHETLHSIDRGNGSKFSHDEGFAVARTADLAALDSYLQQPGAAGLEETFAETGARFFAGDPTLEHACPNLYRFWKEDPLGLWRNAR